MPVLSSNTGIPRRSFSAAAEPTASLLRSTTNSFWSLINLFFEWFGDLGLFLWQVMRVAVRRPFEGRELLRQLD